MSLVMNEQVRAAVDYCVARGAWIEIAGYRAEGASVWVIDARDVDAVVLRLAGFVPCCNAWIWRPEFVWAQIRARGGGVED